MFVVERLTKTYADGTRALHEVSLSVEAGEILAVVGGSGCGKTTLLRLVAGLDRASSGAIAVDGEVLDGPHPAVGRRAADAAQQVAGVGPATASADPLHERNVSLGIPEWC